MTSFRSRLKPPERLESLIVEDAVYGPGFPGPICSICWSVPDYSWGKGHTGEDPLSILEGQEAAERWKDKHGVQWLVWIEIQRCINPDCITAIRYRYLPAKLTIDVPYHPEDMKKRGLKTKESKEFEKGKHDTDGIWKILHNGIWVPKEIEAPDYGVKAKIVGKRAYIRPGDLKNDIPPQWTVEEGWIKTNLGSKRFQEICTWFKQRRVDIHTLLPVEKV